MIDYEKYEVEDFLHDDFFIGWALGKTSENDLFWREWISRHPERRRVVEKAKSLILAIKIIPAYEELTDEEVDSMAQNFQLNISKQQETTRTVSHRFYQTLWFRAAAVILVFTTIGLLFNRKNTNYPPSTLKVAAPEARMLEFTNSTKESKLVRMSDGSLAILKPGSTLKYPDLFSGPNRDVYLEGEAFFEIEKNQQQPFQVRSQNMTTKVLGTSFTVKAFDKDTEFKVIVNTGKVFVYQENSDVEKINAVTLTPNQQVIYKRSDSEFKKEKVKVPLILSKEVAEKEFSYTNTPLSVIISKLNKAYGVKIDYDEEKLGNLTLTASMSDRPLDEKVKLICKAINATCEFTDGRIIIRAEGLQEN